MRKLDVIGFHIQFLSDFGFKFHPNHMLFFKDFDHGQQVVFIHYSEYPDVSYLEYNLGVRIHEVEEIIHRFLPSLSDYSRRSLLLSKVLTKLGRSFQSVLS